MFIKNTTKPFLLCFFFLVFTHGIRYTVVVHTAISAKWCVSLSIVAVNDLN